MPLKKVAEGEGVGEENEQLTISRDQRGLAQALGHGGGGAGAFICPEPELGAASLP